MVRNLSTQDNAGTTVQREGQHTTRSIDIDVKFEFIHTIFNSDEFVIYDFLKLTVIQGKDSSICSTGLIRANSDSSRFCRAKVYCTLRRFD